LIVRLPADLLGHEQPTREVLQEFAAMLDAEGCFTGMSWHDAKAAAAAIIFDAIYRDRPAEFLRHRVSLTASGDDHSRWDDRGLMVRALTIGAEVLGL
jgi:hypothetical protein